MTSKMKVSLPKPKTPDLAADQETGEVPVTLVVNKVPQHLLGLPILDHGRIKEPSTWAFQLAFELKRTAEISPIEQHPQRHVAIRVRNGMISASLHQSVHQSINFVRDPYCRSCI